MPAPRPRRSPSGEQGAGQGGQEGGDKAAAREEAQETGGQAQPAQTEQEQIQQPTMSWSEQAALRRKLREKFH